MFFLSGARAAQAGVAIDPLAWGLSPGTTFRLVVVTAGTTNATSTSIVSYDTFVNTQGLSGITYNGATLGWQAVAQTPASSPVSDASRYSAQANATLIYNLNGGLVSNTTNGSAFWKTTGYNQHSSAIDYTISGGSLTAVNGSQLVWTGFDIDGSVATARDYDMWGMQTGTVSVALGQSAAYNSYDWMTSSTQSATLYPYVGRAGASANGWAAIGNPTLTSSYPMYAMSELITVTAVPEPSTYAFLAGGCGLGIAVCRRHRRRRA